MSRVEINPKPKKGNNKITRKSGKILFFFAFQRRKDALQTRNARTLSKLGISAKRFH
jgi:hypothetical protein